MSRLPPAMAEITSEPARTVTKSLLTPCPNVLGVRFFARM